MEIKFLEKLDPKFVIRVRREMIMFWLCKKNGQNKDIKKGTRIKI
jgi:hypothetical protein